MLKVLIGIPTFNGSQRIDCLLRSILMRTNNNIEYKIVICDDSGKKEHQEKTRLVVDKWKSILPVELLINEKNIGVASSWNRIIKSADSEYIILINDDIIVANHWLENMIYFLENNPNAAAACYNCLFIDKEDIPQLLSSNPYVKPIDPSTKIRMYNFNYDDVTCPIRCMSAWGCLFGFSREKYNLVGGFDENYFAYFEEGDFFTDLASRGYPNYLLTCPKNWHIWSATSKDDPELDIMSIFKKSEEYYIKKWNGDYATNNSRYMSKIPFQKVKWICNNNINESTIIGDYGHFKVEVDGTNLKIDGMDVKVDGTDIKSKEDITKKVPEDIIIKAEEINIINNLERTKIGIGLSIGKDVSPIFLRTMFARVGEWMQKYIVTILIDTDIPIDLSRNNIVQSAIQENCDYLFFIDSDVLIEEGYLERLLSHKKDIIAGVYHQKVFPYYASVKKRLYGNTYYHMELNGDDIIEIDGASMGCLLIKMKIFDKIHYPWFEFKYYKDNGKWEQFSEDLYFCQKLQDIGVKIYCDPSIICTHIGAPVGVELAQKYKDIREKSLKDIIKLKE